MVEEGQKVTLVQTSGMPIVYQVKFKKRGSKLALHGRDCVVVSHTVYSIYMKQFNMKNNQPCGLSQHHQWTKPYKIEEAELGLFTRKTLDLEKGDDLLYETSLSLASKEMLFEMMKHPNISWQKPLMTERYHRPRVYFYTENTPNPLFEDFMLHKRMNDNNPFVPLVKLISDREKRILQTK
jgi:hypothetical protein